MQGPQGKTDHIWVLTILHRHGTETFACKDEGVARRQLYGYVEDGWEDAFGDEPIPEESDVAIDDYFEGNEKESYILIKEAVLEDPV